MLNNTNKISVALAAMLACLMVTVSAAEARFDDMTPRQAAMLRPMLDLVDRTVLSAAPRAPDRLTTASIAPQAETVAPVRRAAPDYNVFKSVVVPVGQLKAFGQWGRVRPTAGEVAELCTGSFCKSTAGRQLAALAHSAADLSQVEALTLVNRTVNRLIRYKSDRGDTWQTLAQSAARGTGDCEDFAIAKMELLAGLGFAPEQLQFIVLKDTRRQLYHAVLAVHVEGKRYILDNLSNTAASDTIFRTYKPIVSFVGTKSYVHGFKGGETAVAMGKGGMAGIRLGEGN
jgi:predicted transglutaminase-like cysteine proteinase